VLQALGDAIKMDPRWVMVALQKFAISGL